MTYMEVLHRAAEDLSVLDDGGLNESLTKSHMRRIADDLLFAVNEEYDNVKEA